jgi:hypothetical protein
MEHGLLRLPSKGTRNSVGPAISKLRSIAGGVSDYSVAANRPSLARFKIGKSAVWKIIGLVWLIPLATGILLLTRVVRGRPALSVQEWPFFFGNTEEKSLSPRWWAKLGLFSLAFFTAGLVEGLIVINIGGWLLAVPLITGLAAIFVVLRWLR